QELRTATDVALRVTKVAAHVLGRPMSNLVVQERQQWLNLVQMKDAEKVHFLNAPIAQDGLFSNIVKDFSINHIFPRLNPAIFRSRSRTASTAPALAPPPQTAPPRTQSIA
ncbi:MAG: hypothetical protein ACRC9V_01210, partial [Aeromonas sp.]